MNSPAAPRLISLLAQPITPEAFRPYGQLVPVMPDGKQFDAADAQLCLDRGLPRFYLMRLPNRGQRFSRITRHRQCTQCLGAIAGQPWLIAVAPPGPDDRPDPEAIVAFQISGACFIKLELGTWHAGPFFQSPEQLDFYNLELNDTNLVDHETCNLSHTYNIQFEIAV